MTDQPATFFVEVNSWHEIPGITWQFDHRPDCDSAKRRMWALRPGQKPACCYVLKFSRRMWRFAFWYECDQNKPEIAPARVWDAKVWRT